MDLKIHIIISIIYNKDKSDGCEQVKDIRCKKQWDKKRYQWGRGFGQKLRI